MQSSTTYISDTKLRSGQEHFIFKSPVPLLSKYTFDINYSLLFFSFKKNLTKNSFRGDLLAKKKCKSFRHDPYMTPNNYDLSFSPSEIPSNIKRENASSLKQRLQKVMPTSKIIHINYDEEPETVTEHNKCNISTKMLLNNKEVKFV